MAYGGQRSLGLGQVNRKLGAQPGHSSAKKAPGAGHTSLYDKEKVRQHAHHLAILNHGSQTTKNKQHVQVNPNTRISHFSGNKADKTEKK